MKNLKFILLAAVSILLSACSSQDQQTSEDLGQSDEMVTEPDILPMVPDGAQAMSLLGKPLYPAEPSPALLDNLAEAKANYDADPDDAMNIIWYGRRVAYTGDYRRAIEIFTEGIEKHPEDARMYRHRGHRYISIREIDRAVADYEMAEKLIQGTEDKIEPDGAPNPQGIFLTSTHSNIYYHLGLSYYLRQDWEKALAAFKAGQDLGLNDDNIVSTGHWIYMIHRRMGNVEAAQASVQNIHKDMTIVENMSYHNLTLMYKGEIPPEELVNIDPNDPSGAAIAYGVANWFLYNGDEERACDLMERFMNTSSWSAFGFIAAEVDLSLR
jgi:tetratricopeptide (TPR) repeat protein